MDDACGQRGARRDGALTLSICTRCRDGREDAHDEERGGARFARAILDAFAERCDTLPPVAIRGVACMSQCKRPCTVALSAPGRFTYLFGDLDPVRDAHAVLDALALYAAGEEGFMRRDERPEPMRAGILGRIPPLDTGSELVVPLAASPSLVSPSLALPPLTSSEPSR